MRTTLITFLFVSIVFSFNGEITKKSSHLSLYKYKTSDVQSSEQYEVELSYEEVLQTYYDLATLNVSSPTISYNEFYDSYYDEESDRDLYSFVLDLARDNGNFTMVYSLFYDNLNAINSKSVSSSEEADYIFNYNSDYDDTPGYAFRRHPLYSFYDYSGLKKGDIVWETETIFFNTGHNAIITNPNQPSFYGEYIQTIEAVAGGVKRGFLDDYRMAKYKCKILRVKNRTDELAERAIYFAKQQVGKPYSFDMFRLNLDIDNSKSWYCSELVYACWKYAGIDIGVKNGNYLKYGCMPWDIGNSDNVDEVTLYKYRFIKLAINKKEDTVWTINVYNATPQKQYVEYTASLCYLREVQNWEGVYNVAGRYISSYSYLMLEMKEYMGEDTIGASYILNDTYRIITYANNLDEKNKTLEQYYNIVKI